MTALRTRRLRQEDGHEFQASLDKLNFWTLSKNKAKQEDDSCLGPVKTDPYFRVQLAH